MCSSVGVCCYVLLMCMHDAEMLLADGVVCVERARWRECTFLLRVYVHVCVCVHVYVSMHVLLLLLLLLCACVCVLLLL